MQQAGSGADAAGCSDRRRAGRQARCKSILKGAEYLLNRRHLCCDGRRASASQVVQHVVQGGGVVAERLLQGDAHHTPECTRHAHRAEKIPHSSMRWWYRVCRVHGIMSVRTVRMSNVRAEGRVQAHC